jgi:sulfur carrier protein
MIIILNQQQISVPDSSLLAEVVRLQVGEKTQGLAVAVNEQVIPKKDWSAFSLHENDAILLIRATQGG